MLVLDDLYVFQLRMLRYLISCMCYVLFKFLILLHLYINLPFFFLFEGFVAFVYVYIVFFFYVVRVEFTLLVILMLEKKRCSSYPFVCSFGFCSNFSSGFCLD